MNTHKGYDTYVGIGYRKTQLPSTKRGRKSDVLALPALYIDIDHSDYDTVTTTLNNMLPPTFLVSSGGGYHAYWVLEQPTRNLFRAERILAGLATYTNGDTTMSADQIMRLPGTINHKPDRKKAPCEIIDGNPNLYTLNDFRSFEADIIIPPPVIPILTLKQIHHASSSTHQSETDILNPNLVDAITKEFQRRGGFMKDNGWMAVYCPYGHKHDRFPGDHAYWNPQKGILHCFGDSHPDNTFTYNVAQLLDINVDEYGGLKQQPA